MRDWSLAPGDPLELTLAADFRLCSPDYADDHAWELELGGGDPPALALHTTYGLRARSMRLFPRFHLEGRVACNPSDFAVPPRLLRFYPNYMLVEYTPLTGIQVAAEYWLPDSHTAAGRLTVGNLRPEPLSLLLELCAQLVPLEGQPLAPVLLQSVHLLAGRCAGLEPVLFLTGGPQPGPGPYPGLALDLALAAGGRRSLTWTLASLPGQVASFEHARRTAARSWEAERARLELVNAAQTVEVQTGDPDWDAAFDFSQKTAFRLFFGPNQHLPHPSFVQARQPDHGHSPRGDGSDHPELWNGQSPLDSYYLASNLPGAPDLGAGLVRNFLSTQAEDSGGVDSRPGLAGQRGRRLAAPLLASLAWQAYRRGRDADFLRQVQTELGAFSRAWLAADRDRDGDGFPEWEHAFQTGLEDSPVFSLWPEGGQGLDPTLAESPALAALLCREFHAQSHIAAALDQPSVRQILELESGKLRALAEECWNSEAALYRLRDRDTHLSPRSRHIGRQLGEGLLRLESAFRQPVRLLVRIQYRGASQRRPEVRLRGRAGGKPVRESLEQLDFQWGPGLAVATSRQAYDELESVEVKGLQKRDLAAILIADYTLEDISLILPLWAEIPNPRRALNLVNRTLFEAGRFGRPFGVPAFLPAGAKSGSAGQAVHLPWNLLVGEGLLAYGLREQAARLTARLMSAVIQNLKAQRAFARAYHAESGAGLGERNALQGLAPLGLFLDVLGVEIHSDERVSLHGKNPFPWPVVVKYRSLKVTRQAGQTVVVFPRGETITLEDPSECVVTPG